MHISAVAFAFNFLISIYFIINTWRKNGSEFEVWNEPGNLLMLQQNTSKPTS